MRSKRIPTRSKPARVTLSIGFLLFVVNTSAYFLQGTGLNDKLAYVSVGLFVVALALYMASVYFDGAEQRQK